jgi:putative spermidine/putrescine transport system permease protein
MTLSRRGLLLILALPAAVEVLFLLLPLISSARMSLNSFGLLSGLRTGFSLANYSLFIHDSYYVQAWLTTLRLTAEASIGATLLGAATAYLLWTSSPKVRSWMTVLILTPLLVSSVVRAYGWIAVAGPTGIVPAITDALGLGRPPFLFHEAGVMVGFIHVYLPIAVLIILGQLDTIQPSHLRAARNLGANWMQVLAKVVVPLTYPAIPSAILLIFALSTAAYSIPSILGGGRVLTIAQIVYDEQNVTLNWPRAAALGITLSAITVTVMLAYQYILTRVGRRGALVNL